MPRKAKLASIPAFIPAPQTISVPAAVSLALSGQTPSFNVTTNIASVGFTPSSSTFQVATPDGSPAHGKRLVITRTSGSWAARPYGASPWIADMGDTVYHAGVAKTPMAPYADGQQLPQAVSSGVYAAYGQEANQSSPNGHQIRLARAGGARNANRPNANTQAWWYSTTGYDNMKCEMQAPIWPSGWGPQNNQRVYLSYWIRSNAAGRAQMDDNGKLGRINGGGNNYMYMVGSNTQLGNIQDVGPQFPTSGGTWERVEYYLDFDLKVWDIYQMYRYKRQWDVGLTTPGPREWRNTSPYNAVTNRGGYLYQSAANNTPFDIGTWSAVEVGTIGWDGQQNAPFTGCEFDIANIYVDTEWERFEISDSPTWSLAPNPFGSATRYTRGTPRELQMRWSRDSATQCTVYINQGQFASLAGKYLWYVDDFKTATLIGQFQASLTNTANGFSGSATTFGSLDTLTITKTGGGLGTGPNLLVYHDMGGGTAGADIPLTGVVGSFTRYGDNGNAPKYIANGYDGSTASRHFDPPNIIGQDAQSYDFQFVLTFPNTLEVFQFYRIKAPLSDTDNIKETWLFAQRPGPIDNNDAFMGINPPDNWTRLTGNSQIYWDVGPANYWNSAPRWDNAGWNTRQLWVKAPSFTLNTTATAYASHTSVNAFVEASGTATNVFSATTDGWNRLDIGGYYRATNVNSNYPHWDDVYVAVGANSAKRFMLTETATWANARQLYILPHTAWADGTASVKLPRRSSGTWTGWHVWYFDANNVRSYVGQVP